MINMAASSAPLSLIFHPKPLHLCAAHNSFSPATFRSTQSSRRLSYYLNLPDAVLTPNTPKSSKLAAINGNFLLSEAIPAEGSQEIVSATDDGVATVIQALLFTAFVGLTILTIGVIYIAVTDFLQKREREKFEKEEADKKKKGKKGKIKVRAGPKGFGQKIVDDDYLDD